MAYVAITSDTLHYIRQRISTLMQQEINSIGKQPILENLTGFTLKADLVEAMFWKPYETLRVSTPIEWQHSTGAFNVALVDAEKQLVVCVDMYHKTTALLRNSMPFDRQAMLPPAGNSAVYGARAYLTHEYFGITAEQLEQQKVYIQRYNAIKEKWDNVRHQVTRFLENCKSLNQAVKLMPSFRLYIPSDMLNKLDEKVSRSPAKGKNDSNPMDGIDMGALNMAAVTAKILGA